MRRTYHGYPKLCRPPRFGPKRSRAPMSVIRVVLRLIPCDVTEDDLTAKVSSITKSSWGLAFEYFEPAKARSAFGRHVSICRVPLTSSRFAETAVSFARAGLIIPSEIKQLRVNSSTLLAVCRSPTQLQVRFSKRCTSPRF